MMWGTSVVGHAIEDMWKKSMCSRCTVPTGTSVYVRMTTFLLALEIRVEVMLLL